MKHSVPMLCLAVAVFFFSSSFAQKSSSSKPALFANYPAIINCTQEQLSKIFAATKGESIMLALNENFVIEGSVKSNLVKYTNLQTMVISLPSFNNILFSLSKRTDADNSIVYVGHLFSKDYADGYELKRNKDNAYQFVKIETERILPTCSQ